MRSEKILQKKTLYRHISIQSFLVQICPLMALHMKEAFPISPLLSPTPSIIEGLKGSRVLYAVECLLREQSSSLTREITQWRSHIPALYVANFFLGNRLLSSTRGLTQERSRTRVLSVGNVSPKLDILSSIREFTQQRSHIPVLSAGNVSLR